MKAKEMFEKLGYEIDIDSAHISYLFKNGSSTVVKS